MNTRAASIQRSVDAVRAGLPIDVVGVRHSGRTSYLAEVGDRLSEDGWRVVWVRGNASLSGTPFGTLLAAGFLSQGTPGQSRPSLPLVVDALAAAAPSSQSVLLIDDWDDLDEASWGAILAFRQRSESGIVLSRVLGRAPRLSAQGGYPATPGNALVARIPALTFREMRAELERRLGGAIDQTTLAQLFAKAGGLIGVACQLVEVARLTGRLVQVEGLWASEGDLWSPELIGVAEPWLEFLSSEERDAHEMLALAGICELETVRRFADWSTLESLEAAELVRVYSAGSRVLITAQPPLLVEYYRHRPRAIRTIRLTESLRSKLGTEPETLPPFSTLGDPSLGDLVPGGAAQTRRQAAVISRLVYEQNRTRALVARADWQLTPSAASTTSYAQALILSGADSAEIEAVLGAELPGAQDRVDTVWLIRLRAEWQAFARLDLEGALRLLNEIPEAWAPLHRMAEVWSVSLRHTLRAVPEDFSGALDLDEDLPDSLRISLLRVRTNLFTTLGRFESAREAIDGAERYSQEELGFSIDSLRGVVLLGLGHSEQAITWSRRGYEEALTALDVEALRGHAAALVYALEADGRYAEAEAILAVALPLNSAPRTLEVTATEVALHGCAGLIAARRGRREEAIRHAEVAESFGLPEVPVLHDCVPLLRAQLLIGENRIPEARELLWQRGQDLFERGYRFPGILLLLSALEITPDPEQLREVTRLAEMLDGEFVHAYLAAVTLQHDREQRSGELVEVAERLVRSGRTGLALSLLQRSSSESDPAAAALGDRLAADILSRAPERVYETARVHPRHTTLTGREGEVARLIAQGLGNAQIAELLVLSVRTVETHVHRIMRKLNCGTRQQVKALILGLG